MQTIAACGIYAGVVWYGISIFDEPDKLDKAFVGLTSLGVTYGISLAMFRTVGEIGGVIMVLAEFLNRHLLEPQKQRLLEEGRKEGRSEGRSEGLKEGREKALAAVRKRLAEDGLNPDDYLPQADGETEG